MEQNIRIVGMRIEKYVEEVETGYSYKPELLQRYIIYGETRWDKIQITLQEEEGMCGSGYCSASWGIINIKTIREFGNITHRLIDDIIIKLDIDNDYNDIKNDLFDVCYDGGCSYYPSGHVDVNMKLFKETNRFISNRPVYILIGDSNIGKSYIAHKLDETTMTVYETDSRDKLPDIIIENVIVKGNKYDFSIEDIKNRIFEEHELIIVEFKKYK